MWDVTLRMLPPLGWETHKYRMIKPVELEKNPSHMRLGGATWMCDDSSYPGPYTVAICRRPRAIILG